MTTSQDKWSPVDSEAHNTPVKKQKVIKRQESLFVISFSFLYFFCCAICQYIYQSFHNKVAKTDAKTSVNTKFLFCKNRWSQQKHFFLLVKYLQHYYKGLLLFIKIPDKISVPKLFLLSSVDVCQVTFKTILFLKTETKQNWAYFPFFLFLYFTEFFNITPILV